MLHKVSFGESPASIARAYGVSTGAVLNANRHKARTVVNGRQTWASVGVGEYVSVGIGDPVADFVAALNAAGGPCVQANAGIVCAIQAALGLKADGKYGNDTATAAKRFSASAPSGCSPAPLWWGKKTDNRCVGAAVPAVPISIPSLPGIPAPVVTPVVTPMPAPSPATIPQWASALASVDPCLAQNAGLVCAAQTALGIKADGKYGNDTATAVRRYVPGARGGCSPAPLWWGGKNDNKCGGVTVPVMPSPVVTPSPVVVSPVPSPVTTLPPITITPGPSPVVTPTPVVTAPTPVVSTPVPVVTAPAPGGGQVVVAPATEKKLSTGAMVAAGVGVLALVGIVAVAASGKKSSSSTTRTTVTRRSPARKRKSASRRKKK